MHVRSAPHDGRGFEYEFSGYTFDWARQVFGWHSGCCFKSAMRRVKKCQRCLNWNPARPRTPLAQCLFRRVSARLGSRKASELRLFMAIGSSLDLMGVDCWFERDHLIATIDLTVSIGKVEPKANFVITRDNFLRDEYYQVSDLIAERLY